MKDIRTYEYGTPRSKKEVLKGLCSYNEKRPCYVVFRPVGVTGSLRYARYTVDHSDDIINACKALGLIYETGNDAPKGGKLGKFINVLIKQERICI